MLSRSTFAAVILGTLSSLLIGTSDTLAEPHIAQSAIVVPARHAFLQLAVDIKRFNSNLIVIGFRKSQSGPDRLFIWNESTKSWARMPIADYQSGAVFSGRPTRVVLVDTDESIPESLKAVPPLVKETTVVSAASIGDLLNKLAPVFALKESQFRAIAKWNNLTLTDHNADRRKYGRWGKPGSEASSESSSVESMEVHQGVQETAMRQPELEEPVAVTEYDEAEAGYTESVSVEETAAPASELPVMDVVSEQPEAAIDPSNK